jgi:hypothetical protein
MFTRACCFVAVVLSCIPRLRISTKSLSFHYYRNNSESEGSRQPNPCKVKKIKQINNINLRLCKHSLP